MSTCLILSSYVAASRVGGGIAPFILPPLGVDPIHIPTTLLGRHAGWGAPGGGGVPDALFEGMIEGASAQGVLTRADAVLTGYFASVDQVSAAAAAIDEARADGAKPLVVVDPIMGDHPGGLYVSEAVADAIARELVPRADVITPNAWELARLSGRLLDEVAKPSGALKALRGLGKAGLASSLSTEAGVGVLWCDEAAAHLAETPFRSGDIPYGTGDVLAACFIGRRLAGHSPERALALALGSVAAIIERALSRRTRELPLAHCADLVTSPPDVDLRPLDG